MAVAVLSFISWRNVSESDYCYSCSVNILFSEPHSPRHKRTKRLLRAPVATRGPPRVVYMKLPFIFILFLFYIRDICQWTVVIIQKCNIK